jgi:predicted RNA-binding protein with PIN domain
MPFVIDGYNLLQAMGLLGGPVGPNQLAKARAALCGLMAAAHAANPATIVFDARRAPAEIATEEDHGPVRVEYATTEEADDRIEWLIAHDPAPKRLVVVSDDHRLRQAAKRRGCPAWKCDEYLTWLEKERRRHNRPVAGEKPAGVGPMETDRWLAAFGDLDRDPAWDELFGPFDDGAGI